MASCMVDVDEGTNTKNIVQNDQESLVSYLNKHKLPIDKFKKFGLVINDLINFDDEYFKGFCNDMGLNSLESLRFAKLIQELNQKTNNKNNCNALITNIQSDSKYAKQTIDALFDTLIETVNERRNELKERLNEITKQKIDYITMKKPYQHKTSSSSSSKIKYIEFIFSNFCSIKDTLCTIGKIEDLDIMSNNNNKKKAPSFSLNIADDKMCCINIQIEEKMDDENIEYEIKYKEEDEKEWNITNKLIISGDNIKPLTKYMICVRYLDDNIDESEWSQIQLIQTKFGCIWDTRYHGKNIQLIDEYEIFVDAHCSSYNDSYCGSSIIGKYMFDGEILKKIKYEFIINEFCQPSMFGFVKYPTNITMKHYWNSNMPLIENKHSFLVSAMDGLKYIHRYKNGKNTETGILSIFNNGIALKNPIKKGDHFIFDIDFDAKICNLYINNERCKVSAKQNEATWTNIPNKMYPCYSHYCDSKLVNKNSRCKIHLIHHELR